MTTYTVTVSSDNFMSAIGSPTLSGTDTILVGPTEDERSFTTNLGGFTTAVAEIVFMSGFTGMIGNGEAALTLQADKMFLQSMPPSVALRGLGSGTVSLFVWAPEGGSGGSIDDYADMDDLRVITPAPLEVLENCVVDAASISAGAMVTFRAGTAMGALTVSGTAMLYRDVGTLHIFDGEAHCLDSTVTPTTVNIHGPGSRVVLQGSTVTVNAGHSATIDLSRATGNLTITWNIDGPITIIEPPLGVTYTAPPSDLVRAGLIKIVKTG